MRVSRKFTDQALAAGQDVILEAEAARYLGRVLRLRVSDRIVLFNGDGHDYVGEITRLGKAEVEIALESRLPAAAESRLNLTLVQAIARGERMDYSLQKATELGVTSIVPLFSRRVEVKLDGARLDKRMAHWRGVITSACEQSGRAVVPALHNPVSLDQWMARPASGTSLVLDPSAELTISSVMVEPDSLNVVIGPEGGLEDAEIAALIMAGHDPVSLGPRVLRTETAGPAVIAVCQALFGDFC